MLRGIIVSGALGIAVFASACVVAAQQPSGRMYDLAAQLDKTKHKVKDKGAVHIEVYTEVRNEPVLMQPAALSGHYAIPEAGEFMIDLNVANDGTAAATGVGYKTRGGDSVPVRFTFKGRVDGALLTGTQVFEDGRQETLEAVFVNRTVRSGKNPDDAGVTSRSFGIGYIFSESTMTHRVFLEKK